MKTLASCKPTEFLKQTNAIRKSVEKWLTATDIMNIRKRLPEKEIPTISMTLEERQAMELRNKKATEEQMKQNMSAMLDAALETHAEETLELLALCCFVDPKNVDDYPVSEYLKAFNELINDESVVGFFTSLVRLVPMDMPSV